MNEKKLLEAVGEVNDSYVEEAAGYRKSRKAPLWLRWGAVAACLCIAVLGGSLLLRGGEGLTPDPAPVEVTNPVISVATVEEMEAMLSVHTVYAGAYNVDVQEYLDEYYVNDLISAEECAQKIQDRTYMWLNE